MRINNKNIKLPLWEQLPDLDIYMDQLVNLCNRYLVDTRVTVVTSSMINSYVKKQLLPRPIKKKYNKQHICLLMLILLLKRIYTLDTVDQFLHIFFDSNDCFNENYNHFCKIFNQETIQIDYKNSYNVMQQAILALNLQINSEFTIQNFQKIKG